MRNVLMGFLCLLFTVQIAQAQSETSNDTLILGGAFRYTYMNNSWDKTHDDIGGRLIFDAIIFTAKGQVKGIEFAVENRCYAQSFGGLMLRNGYVGLPLTKNLKLKLGMPRTPFGIMPFTGNSFMFNMQYYLGFEDDADLGALLEYNKKNFEAQLSFAKNSEDIFSQGNRRYAYDISVDNQEINQFTGRAAYHFGEKTKVELGASGQYGGVYNKITEEMGNHWAAALHSVIKKGAWDLKLELIAYEFSTKDTAEVDYIQMGAFASDYQIAKKGVTYSVALGYKIMVNHRLLNDIKFYNDFSALEKSVSSFDASYMNVTGCMLHTGPIYMLVDYVIAKNHAWIGNNYTQALSSGGDTKWNKRFNVSLGVYF